MTHPIIKAWQRGETDTGGCIAGLERENAALRKALHGFVESFDHGEHESWERVAVARKLLEGHSAGTSQEFQKGDRVRIVKGTRTAEDGSYAARVGKAGTYVGIWRGSYDGEEEPDAPFPLLVRIDGEDEAKPFARDEVVRDVHRALPCKGCNGKGYRDMGLEATGVECSECEGSGESHREDSSQHKP